MRIIKNIFDAFIIFIMKLRNIRVYTLNGGLGDVFQLIDYLNSLPKDKSSTVVYYLDKHNNKNPENYSYNLSRSYTSKDGHQINPINEFLSFYVEKKIIDCAIGKDIKKSTYGVRLYCEFIKENNQFFESSILKDFLLNDSNYLIKSLGINSNKINISVHLRRNSDEILEIVYGLNEIFPNKIQFLILGSSEHQIIPEILNDIDAVSLIDSYSKGLSMREVLTLSCNSKFFIGGRGGFEYFHLRTGVPSITIFDQGGFDEIKRGWWNKRLWDINEKSLLLKKDFKRQEILNYLTDHLND